MLVHLVSQNLIPQDLEAILGLLFVDRIAKSSANEQKLVDGWTGTKDAALWNTSPNSENGVNGQT